MIFARALGLDSIKQHSYMAFFAAFTILSVFIVVLYGLNWDFWLIWDDKLFLLLPFVVLISLCVLTMWIGFTLYTESINDGGKAIRRLWKLYAEGKLPKLYLVSMESHEGKAHMVFSFTDSVWHPSIDVYIPVRTVTKLLDILDDRRVMMDPEQFKREVKLSEDDAEAFMFISYLLETQGERIQRMLSLLRSMEDANLSPQEYLKEILK